MKQKQNIFFRNFLAGSVILLLILRLLGLENKPIHHDESVNAWWISQITENGFFSYDPTNYHGPLYFYIQWIFERFLGSDLWVLRFVPVLFSILTVFLLWKRDYKWGALVMALSPAFFFFSRSGIHEAMFVFFQVLLVLGWLDLYHKKDRALLLIVIGLVGSLANKETWIISFISMLIASVFFGYRFFLLEAFPKKMWRNSFQMICLGFVLWFVLFTGFFQNIGGAIDFFKAFLPWLQTGSYGGGHEKSFWFWVEMLFKYESLLALVFILATIFVLKTRQAQKKFAFLYAFFVIQLLIYSLIPYKTVWCLISLLWPLCLMIDRILEERWLKRIFLGLGAVLCLWQGALIDRLNFQDPIDFTHSYVYSQSTQELKNFSDALEIRSQREPGFLDQRVIVMLDVAWPFPWVFRDYSQVTYINMKLPEPELTKVWQRAHFVITDQERFEKIQLHANDFQVQKFPLRFGDTLIYILEKIK